jgi:catechol 2,3-dioxygenase-like lactoylglutathione lyase family enzyme
VQFIALDHVQLAIPEGEEATGRRFYSDVLGLGEVPKPPSLAGRGGAWFASGGVELHLGVERDFQPARKAHPAIRVAGLSELASRCEAAGYPVEFDTALPGIARFYVLDPFGNRLEFLEPGGDA